MNAPLRKPSAHVAEAARMGISAARNPHAHDSAQYHAWHAAYQAEMARRATDAKQAAQYRRLAERYRLMAENAAMFDIRDGEA